MYEPTLDWSDRELVRESRGYVRVFVPEHPKAFCNGWVYEHRLVAERALGRLLRCGESVHHLGGKGDNSEDSLVVMDIDEHAKIHNDRPSTYKHKLRDSWVSKSCNWCGEVFWGAPSTMKRRKSCSRKCIESHRGRSRVCPFCGVRYKVNRANEGNAFCSTSCCVDASRVLFNCESCGEEAVRDVSRGTHRFCSDSCRLSWFSSSFSHDESPHWKGDCVGYYGPSWKSAREKVRERAGFRCEFCSLHEDVYGRSLDAAHIEPFREFGVERHEEANRVGNLLALCRSCHTQFDYANGASS